MPRIARDVTWLVGRTPLVALDRLEPGLPGRLVAKLEARNPSASNKDRAALAMIEHAERSGALGPGTTLIECSAGDLGLALASICAVRGYRLVLTMPANSPAGRTNLLRSLGAELVLTEPSLGMRGAMLKADELQRIIQPSLILQPFSNTANARAHARGTAREIWEDSDGTVHTVVCPVGSGGTAAGCAAFFRETAPQVRIVGVEPRRSAVLGGGAPGAHDIVGIGAGFVPGILAAKDLHEVIAVDESEAFAAVRGLARREGILAGPASGAVTHAALTIARRRELGGRLVVAILPDHGERFGEHACHGARTETT